MSVQCQFGTHGHQMDLCRLDVLLLLAIWNQNLILFTVLLSLWLRKHSLKIKRFGLHLIHIHGPVTSIKYRVMLCILWLYDKPRKNLTGSPRGSVMALTLSCNHRSMIFVLISLELLYLCMCLSEDDNTNAYKQKEDSNARRKLCFSCDYDFFTVCHIDWPWMCIMQCTYILSDSLIRSVIYVVCLLYQKSTKW